MARRLAHERRQREVSVIERVLRIDEGLGREVVIRQDLFDVAVRAEPRPLAILRLFELHRVGLALEAQGGQLFLCPEDSEISLRDAQHEILLRAHVARLCACSLRVRLLELTVGLIAP